MSAHLLLPETNLPFVLSCGGVAALVSTTQPLPPPSLYLSPLLHPSVRPDALSLSPSLRPIPRRDLVVALQANFTLPESGDFLDDVKFPELEREDADKLVKEYNEEGRKAGPPPDKRMDSRQGGFRGRGSSGGSGAGGGSFQRYDNRDGPRSGYQSRGGTSGNGYRGGEGVLRCGQGGGVLCAICTQ